MMEENKSLF